MAAPFYFKTAYVIAYISDYILNFAIVLKWWQIIF